MLLKPAIHVCASLMVHLQTLHFFMRDDIVSQCLKFESAFLSYSWESKIALFLLTFPYPKAVLKKLCDFYWLQIWIAPTTKKRYCNSIKPRLSFILCRRTKVKVSVWHWHWIIGLLFWFCFEIVCLNVNSCRELWLIISHWTSKFTVVKPTGSPYLVNQQVHL